MTIPRTHRTATTLGALQEHQRACWFAALAIGREQRLTSDALLATWQQACWPWMTTAAQLDRAAKTRGE